MADVEKDIVLRVKSETDQAQGQFKSLKQELRSIEQQLNQMAESGDTGSEAFRKLQQRAGQVKDQIGDTKSAIKALSSDTFKLDAFSQAAQGIAGGFAAAQGAMALFGTENKAVEEAIKKTQGAMALLQGVTAITNILQKDSAFSLMFLGKAQTENTIATEGATVATKGFSKALIATGIGAIVVLIGTLVAYWDDLASAVSGVSQETEKYLETAKLDTEAAQKKLQYTKDTENVMKLQGKSQRYILNLKIKESEAVILTIKDQIKGQQLANKQAIEGAKRNKDLVVGILNVLTYPMKLFYQQVQKVVNGLIETANYFGAGIDFRLNIPDNFQNTNEYIASFLFDPDEVKKEGDKSLEEMTNTLTKMQNENAGFKLELQKMDEDDRKKEEEARIKANEERIKKDEELKKQLTQNEKDFLDRTNKEYEDAKKMSDAYFDHLINNAKLNGEDTANLELQKLENQLQIQKDYGLSTTEIEDKIALKKKEINEKSSKELKALEDKERQMSLNADLKYLNDSLESTRLSLEKKKKLLKEYYLNGIISETQYNEAINKLELTSAQKRKEIFDFVVKTSQQAFSNILAFRENQMNKELRMAKGNEKEQERIRKEYFERNKKVQIAEAIIQAIAGAQGAFSQTAKSPITTAFPLAPYIASASALATGLANVQKIRQSQYQGGSISSSSNNAPNLSPSNQATQTSGLDSTQLQLDAQGNLLQQRSIRTYVLETDISAKQQRSKRLQQTATLGK